MVEQVARPPSQTSPSHVAGMGIAIEAGRSITAGRSALTEVRAGAEKLPRAGSAGTASDTGSSVNGASEPPARVQLKMPVGLAQIGGTRHLTITSSHSR